MVDEADLMNFTMSQVTTVKSSSVKPVIKDDPTEAVPGKVYTCNRCDQKVFGREPMKRHAATHHENEIIQCTTCYEFFITHAAYSEHKKQAHLTLLNLVGNYKAQILLSFP